MKLKELAITVIHPQGIPFLNELELQMVHERYYCYLDGKVVYKDFTDNKATYGKVYLLEQATRQHQQQLCTAFCKLPY